MNPLEKQLIEAGENATVDPRLFTVAVGDGQASITLPLGMDYRFCRGMSLNFGKSALNELTVELVPDEEAHNRPGMVNRSDTMCHIGSRKVQIRLSAEDARTVPKFRRTRAAKCWIQRSKNILLTMSTITMN